MNVFYYTTLFTHMLILKLNREFEGHDRLVKVAHQDEFELLIQDIGTVFLNP